VLVSFTLFGLLCSVCGLVLWFTLSEVGCCFMVVLLFVVCFNLYLLVHLLCLLCFASCLLVSCSLWDLCFWCVVDCLCFALAKFVFFASDCYLRVIVLYCYNLLCLDESAVLIGFSCFVWLVVLVWLIVWVLCLGLLLHLLVCFFGVFGLLGLRCFVVLLIVWWVLWCLVWCW